ncbi:MAG TPA: hypothetical protein VGM88_12435 [Kofleriaceae bacterium]|jgi:hypothetical protein
MRHPSLALAALMLAACGDKAKLWIAPNGDELHLKLVEQEPPPF